MFAVVLPTLLLELVNSHAQFIRTITLTKKISYLKYSKQLNPFAVQKTNQLCQREKTY